MGTQPALAALFIGLGILLQGKLQQSAERFGPRFKSVVEPERRSSKQALSRRKIFFCFS
jgi:hypothetical protein